MDIGLKNASLRKNIMEIKPLVFASVISYKKDIEN